MKVNYKRVEPKGLGDTLKEIFDKTGVTIVFQKVKSELNIEDCGCDKRREALNKLFPYKNQNG